MKTFDFDAIAAAFSTTARLVERGERVVFTKLPGLNPVNCTFFKEAITRGFNERDNGFRLQRIFILEDDGKTLHRNTSPNQNPQNKELISLIIKAMSYLAKERRNARKNNQTEEVTLDVPNVPNVVQESLTTEALLNMLQERGYNVKLEWIGCV